ncbi:MAG TPA: MATE family efflux transporter [Clostridia bacterium]|nr:MATE family efflux transporter [Clostridia bacterium]
MLEKIDKTNLLRTFLKYSIPCIIGMFLTSFITVVDGIIIGWKVGEMGLAAVNLTLPVLYMLLGITIMVGVGGLTLAVQSLGEKDRQRADRRFTFTVIFNAAVNILAAVILIVFRDSIIGFLNAKGGLYPYVRDYLGTMGYFYTFMMMNITFSMFIRGEGKPQLSLLFGILANILNIILDYIFIIRLDYGMRGAALASGLSVIVAFALGFLYFARGKSVYRYCRISFDMNDFKNIVFNGSSEFIGQISISITTFLFNLVIIRSIGVNGVAAFTIVGYISLIQYMVLTGIAQGIHPLISYSYGAKDRDTIFLLLSIGIKAVLLTGAAAFILSFGATEGIIRIFAHGNADLMNIANYGIKIYSITFLINGFNVIASAYFTSLGDAATSALISVLRSLILISIFILILPVMLGETGIWLAAPLTEAITFVVSYAYIKRSRSRLTFADNSEGRAY